MTSRYPLILDGNNTATRLLIQHTHELNCHCGPEQTRKILMEYYWILQCWAVVKQMIRHCLPCRRKIQDVSIPKMADQFVFQTTGLDFIGPFPVKSNGKLFSRCVLIFTCLAARADHLEVSKDLSTDSTTNCTGQFFSRKGKHNTFFFRLRKVICWFKQQPTVQQCRPKSVKIIFGEVAPYESRNPMKV